MIPLRQHRQQDLAGAAQLAKASEDQSDYFLDLPVGIKAETDLAMPDVADRHADPQLAAPGFGAGGIEHAGLQHAEFELADAALHAEQQPVVRPARVVDSIEINDLGPDQPAELQQVTPIATVAGEPGRVKAQHGADLAGAQPRDEPFEPWSRRRTAGRTAKIIVDHFNITEPVLPGDIDQLVLPPPAFEIGLDLLLGRLANVNHRLAL